MTEGRKTQTSQFLDKKVTNVGSICVYRAGITHKSIRMMILTSLKCTLCLTVFTFSPRSSHLHHQDDGVESDHGQDSVLKGGGHHKMPQSVLECVPVLRHVSGQGLGADRKVNARPLKTSQKKKKKMMGRD